MPSLNPLVSDLGLAEEVSALEQGLPPPVYDSTEPQDFLSAGALPSATKVKEEAYDRAQIEEAARLDLNFLAGLAMPEVFEYFFPKMYLAIWTWLLSFLPKDRQFPRLVLGMPRGFAKTTFVKLFILYCILFTNKRFILSSPPQRAMLKISLPT